MYENRDKLLGEIHANSKTMMEWTKEHDKKDDKRFDDINKKLIIGIILIGIISFYSGTLAQVLSHIKL